MKSKVSIAKCVSYEKDDVESAVRRSVDLLGGIASFVNAGEKVLIKPNLLTARKPEEGVDTHPEAIRAAVRLAKEAGGIVSVGDSPGGLGKNIDEVHEVSGVKKMAEEEGIELVKFTKSKNVNGFPVSRYVLEADKIISVPKFKTHGITVITAGIKNMFGAIIGLSKAHCHKVAPNALEFARLLAGIYAIRKPDLNILDAVVSMEGDGPATGDLRKTDFIMASPDAVSMDAVLSFLIGIDPMSIPVTKEAHARGMGEADLSNIDIVSDGQARDFKLENFKIPQTQILRLMPNVVMRLVLGFLEFSPKINTDVCKKCNLCRTSCPVEAIDIADDRYRIDTKKCIKCLCCQEVCPYKAIFIEQHPLAKYIWR